MKIDIITCLPEIFEGPMNQSIVKRSQEKGLVELSIHDLRAYSTNKHKSVDDYAYGGGAGMVLMIEPIDRCISELKSKNEYDEIIYLTPDGELLDQKKCNELSLKKNIILLCGHYEGVDHRVIDELVDLELSIGDYILTNGAIAAAVVCDALIRLLPGALGDARSPEDESFSDPNMLEAPAYTKPAEFRGMKVPDVLLSGHHAEIEKWKAEKARERTRQNRPDLSGE